MLTLDKLHLLLEGAIFDVGVFIDSDVIGDSVKDYFRGIKMGYICILDLLDVSKSVEDSES